MKNMQPTFGGFEPQTQVQIVESLPVEKVADVLEKMPADEAADLLDETGG